MRGQAAPSGKGAITPGPRSDRRDASVALASTAIAAASAIRRIMDGTSREHDHETLQRARDTLLQVAESARIPLPPGASMTSRGAVSVAEARLALEALGGTDAEVDERLRGLLRDVDTLIGGDLPEDVETVLGYFERLAEASLLSGSSTGETLIGARRAGTAIH